MTLPTEATKRKEFPIATGVVDYFPDALAAVAEVSFVGNEQHNPGSPLHWDRSKSTDEADAMMRHFIQRGTLDSDGMRHSAKAAWRMLALLQKEIEGDAPSRTMMVDPDVLARAVECYALNGPGNKSPHVRDDGPGCTVCGITPAEAAAIGHDFFN